jgi:hypothetical protein
MVVLDDSHVGSDGARRVDVRVLTLLVFLCSALLIVDLVIARLGIFSGLL